MFYARLSVLNKMTFTINVIVAKIGRSTNSKLCAGSVLQVHHACFRWFINLIRRFTNAHRTDLYVRYKFEQFTLQISEQGKGGLL